jgi:hypothetical protein
MVEKQKAIPRREKEKQKLISFKEKDPKQVELYNFLLENGGRENFNATVIYFLQLAKWHVENKPQYVIQNQPVIMIPQATHSEGEEVEGIANIPMQMQGVQYMAASLNEEEVAEEEDDMSWMEVVEVDGAIYIPDDEDEEDEEEEDEGETVI